MGEAPSLGSRCWFARTGAPTELGRLLSRGPTLCKCSVRPSLLHLCGSISRILAVLEKEEVTRSLPRTRWQYYNQFDGRRQWEFPADDPESVLPQASEAPAPDPTTAAMGQPSRWYTAQDQYQRTYYVDSYTGATTYDQPPDFFEVRVWSEDCRRGSRRDNSFRV